MRYHVFPRMNTVISVNYNYDFSHDRTMQDIVYKLVPGLQEGKSV